VQLNVKALLARLTHGHHMNRHFRRLITFDWVRRSVSNTELSKSHAQWLIETAKQEPNALLASLDTALTGLNQEQVAALQEKVGLNEIGTEKPLPWWTHLWNCFCNPFNLLLTALAITSFYTDDIPGTIVILTMVILSILLRFVQEVRSNNAAERLKDMVSTTATVIREVPKTEDNENPPQKISALQHTIKHEVPIKELVPGDIVLLSAGDMIPADVRLLSAKDLFISQASMTGESLPIEKFASLRSAETTNALELENICFMGTDAVSGTASAVVVATGLDTYFGALAQRITAIDPRPTSFQIGINKVSMLLLKFIAVMTPIVLLINGFTKGDWLDATLFALSIAVGLTPEMLPMIVTATLAKGAVFLSRKKVIVKHLDSVQNFGAMNILCTDKTGTLTQNKIALQHHTDAFGVESAEVLEPAYLNSYYQTGLKNLLDVAILEYAKERKELDIVASQYQKIDEIPFDFKRRRMSVIVAKSKEQHLLICKGAVEEILTTCSTVRQAGVERPLDDDLKKQLYQTTSKLNHDGLRVVAVAIRELPGTRDTYSVNDEQQLMLIGYVAFLDPPKESAAPALKALQANGIKVKVLTGDNELVTAKICREVGIDIGHILLGQEIETMSNSELASAAENASVFAKLAPSHKERIVQVLHDKGHVVGFLGDGINDAAALRAADIGISVDSALDIAKESADIILLEKSLLVLNDGVIEGRRTFANMLKYIKMAASSNFGNVFSVLLASILLPFLPMLPLQLLIQNLLYDISQTAIPFDKVDEEFLRTPRRWSPSDIGRFMVFFGPISSIFDMVTFSILWFLYGANTLSLQGVFQTGWFIEGLVSQTLIVHMIRTRHIPFVQSRASWPLIFATSAVIAIGMYLPFSIFASYFDMQPLPYSYFIWLGIIVLSYMLLTQAVKGFYTRRYGWQ